MWSRKAIVVPAVLLMVGLTVLAVALTVFRPLVVPAADDARDEDDGENNRDPRLYEHCYADLRAIDVAKQYWALENKQPVGSTVTWSNLHPRYIREVPRCQGGGTYTLGNIGALPSCSITNSPWHQRHYYLNYSDDRFVIGKRVRCNGRAKNTGRGPIVVLGDNPYKVEGLRRWSPLDRNRKVTVFGLLSGGNPYVITDATYERGYFTPSSGEGCIARAKQVEGAKAT